MWKRIGSRKIIIFNHWNYDFEIEYVLEKSFSIKSLASSLTWILPMTSPWIQWHRFLDHIEIVFSKKQSDLPKIVNTYVLHFIVTGRGGGVISVEESIIKAKAEIHLALTSNNLVYLSDVTQTRRKYNFHLIWTFQIPLEKVENEDWPSSHTPCG